MSSVKRIMRVGFVSLVMLLLAESSTLATWTDPRPSGGLCYQCDCGTQGPLDPCPSGCNLVVVPGPCDQDECVNKVVYLDADETVIEDPCNGVPALSPLAGCVMAIGICAAGGLVLRQRKLARAPGSD